MAVPTTALEDAVALLTVAMHAGGDELENLVREFLEKDRSQELLLAVVALCRSLVFSTAKMAHAVEDHLTTQEAIDMTDAEARPAALQILRIYAHKAGD